MQDLSQSAQGILYTMQDLSQSAQGILYTTPLFFIGLLDQVFRVTVLYQSICDV